MKRDISRCSGFVLLFLGGVVGSACNSSTNAAPGTDSSTYSVEQAQQYRPWLPDSCAGIQGCTPTAGGFQFPDGAGGTVTCTNGSCVDHNPNPAYEAAFNAGFSYGDQTGYADGYNGGYNDGHDDGYDDGWDDGYRDGVYASNVVRGTKDVDLQRASLERLDVQSRAQFISDQFQMSYDSAVQLTRLSDRVKAMSIQGKMTSTDRAAIQASALGIAGITSDDIARAFEQGADQPRAIDDLMEKAAENLGMPSSAALRDKLLPSLGVQL